MPRNPDVAAGLADEGREGTWYLIRADFLHDAISHARGVVLGQCQPVGLCTQCAAESVGVGSWQEIIDLAANTRVSISLRQPPDFKVPTLRGLPRYFELPSG